MADSDRRPDVVAAFPSDRLTVADGRQLTGRRVQLPLPDCGKRPSDCNEIRLVNRLDGFDTLPRIEIRFDGPVDVDDVHPGSAFVRELSGGRRKIGLDQLVWDGRTDTLYAHPARPLAQSTRHELVVKPPLTSRVRSERFTTMSATAGLLQVRRRLDDGSAYEAAGITPEERRLRFHTLEGDRAVFDATRVRGVTRVNDTGAGGLVPTQVPLTSLPAASLVAFGSFASPSWLTEDRVFTPAATAGNGPAVTGREDVGFILIVPAGPRPEGGWPVAVFGHGLTSDSTRLFSAADFNASRGIATVAVNVVGHGFGPGSRIELDMEGGSPPVRVPGSGRGVDLDGDGSIGSFEGVMTEAQPHRLASARYRDGLRQTVADLMALVRAIARGVDVDGDGRIDLRRDSVSYYGQSLGGMYGIMLGGVDPRVPVIAPNVAGGGVEIGRLSPGFRPGIAAELGQRQPSLLNGGLTGFTESVPLRGEPAVTDPAPGAVPIQEALSRIAWIMRPGSPESYAPLLRLSPPDGSPPKRVLLQVALGDRSMPNPSSDNVVKAGSLRDVTTLYRNDLTRFSAMDPHPFLTSGSFEEMRTMAQRQVTEFLASGGRSVTDPDGEDPVFEVPITDPAALERLNFSR